MKDPAGGVCEEEAEDEEEEGGRREEDRSPRGGGGGGEPRAAPGDRALPRGRDAGRWGIFAHAATLTPAASSSEEDHTCACSRFGGEMCWDFFSPWTCTPPTGDSLLGLD
ncbi:uncharacterized protein LOC124229797 isoform X5 [Equus quagga]|uniref:uncharacterized protein LOC124229797 isoform X5 n=1 Tax=Equus quagga TaxID=89248 RepID=UPI001EE2C942|nr:uncharacterized protein LOC124229797 isoform X5 [Equus quagga]